MRTLVLLVSFLLTSLSYAQIEVSKVGDGWNKKVDSALLLIKKTDIEKYQLIDSVCEKVDFWISGVSSNEGSYGTKGIILVAVKEFTFTCFAKRVHHSS